MNDYIRPGRFTMFPPVVKNILIINALFFIATLALERSGIDLNARFGLYYPLSGEFKWYQLITYMFLHSNFMHLFFNMFALWMFGYVLENLWGPKKFLFYYFATGIGAALSQLAIYYFQITPLLTQVNERDLNMIINEGAGILQNYQNFIDPVAAKLNILMNIPMIGASGSVFGILLAFGMLFPNQRIMIYGIIPIKALYFVIGYGALEFFLGVGNAHDNVAHFAHLGGMLFGIIILFYWKYRYKLRMKR